MMMTVTVTMTTTMKMMMMVSRYGVWTHLPGSLHVNGDDVEAVAAELAGPGASFTDPLQQTVLVGVAHGAVTAAWVQ